MPVQRVPEEQGAKLTMQKSKTRSGPSAVAQKTSPVTPRPTRQAKAAGTESGSSVSTPSSARSPTTKSPKSIEKKAPKSPASEKKPLSRVSKLESQLSQVQSDLKKTKELLNSSESSKVRALEEASEAKKQYLAIAADFEDTKRQLLELSLAGELQEVDSAPKTSENVDCAVNEIVNLKLLKSESDLESEVPNTMDSELQMLKTHLQLQVANSTIRSLHSDGLKVVGAFKAACSELEASKCQITSLEDVMSALRSEVNQMKSALEASEIKLKEEQIKSDVQIFSLEETVNSLKKEVDEANFKVSQLTASLIEKDEELAKALELTETLKREMEQLKTSDEEVSEMKSNLVELKAELTGRETELQVLRSTLAEKDTQLQEVLVANERLKEEVQKFAEDQTMGPVVEVAELKENLMDKETELQSISEENKVLRTELQKKEEEAGKNQESALADLEAAKCSQRDTMDKLERAVEEADKSNQRVAKLTEQLEAVRVASSEMEAELKRLRVQTDQWRKAAEAAAAILNTGSNTKVSEKSGPIESDYLNFGGKVLSSPYSDELDEDASTKPKKTTMLKKIGVLWKKGQK